MYKVPITLLLGVLLMAGMSACSGTTKELKTADLITEIRNSPEFNAYNAAMNGRLYEPGKDPIIAELNRLAAMKIPVEQSNALLRKRLDVQKSYLDLKTNGSLPMLAPAEDSLRYVQHVDKSDLLAVWKEIEVKSYMLMVRRTVKMSESLDALLKKYPELSERKEVYDAVFASNSQNVNQE